MPRWILICVLYYTNTVGPNTDSKEEERPKLLERGAVGRVQVQDISKIKRALAPHHTSRPQQTTPMKIRFFFFINKSRVSCRTSTGPHLSFLSTRTIPWNDRTATMIPLRSQLFMWQKQRRNHMWKQCPVLKQCLLWKPVSKNTSKTFHLPSCVWSTKEGHGTIQTW